MCWHRRSECFRDSRRAPPKGVATVTQYDGYAGTQLALYYWHTDIPCGRSTEQSTYAPSLVRTSPIYSFSAAHYFSFRSPMWAAFFISLGQHISRKCAKIQSGISLAFLVFALSNQGNFIPRTPSYPHQLSISSSALAVASSSSPPPSLASVSPAQARHAQVSLRPSDAAMRSALVSS